MDQGVNYGFNSQGIDPATFGLPNWADGWHKVVIVGSAAKPQSDPSKGGRLQFKVKCIEGPEAGKEHFVGLNLYHNDPDTKKRAEQEMASICAVTGKPVFQNTAELYNIPFYILAETQTSSPTPQYPNPKPQTNFRGYRDVNGNEPGKSGQGGGQMGGQGGPPANFGGQPAPQFVPGQGGSPQGGQPQFNPGQPQQPAFNPNGNNGQQNGQNFGGQPQFAAQPGAGAPFQPNAATTGFPAGQNGGNAPFPSNGQPGGQQGGQPQQFQPQQFQPQGGQQFQQPQQGGGQPQWNPQGGGQPAQGGGWPGQ